MEKKNQNKSRYISGLNGLRSIAVIGVIFYHLFPNQIRGGYLGVAVFYVISGYLITDHLRQEWQSTNKINFKEFYLRRLKRLYPALLAVLVVSSAYITLFQRNLLTNLRGIVFSSLTYTNNWWQIRHGLSYFDRFNNESPFTHLWSLGVEGQNYLLWPIVFFLLMMFVKKKKHIIQFLFAATLISALFMGFLYTPGSDPSRVYYGTDTRLFSLWLGNLLAFIWPSTHLRKDIPLKAKHLLNLFGGVALLLLGVAFLYLDARYRFVYYGGMYLISFVIVVLVAVIAHPGASWDKWLTNPVFTYLGQRSYSLYLWQFPVMIFYEAKVKNINKNLWLHTLIELILIFGISELSYRLAEQKGKKINWHALKMAGKSWFTKPTLTLATLKKAASLFVILSALVGIVFSKTESTTAEQQAFQERLAESQKLAEQSKNQGNTNDAEKDTTKEESKKPESVTPVQLTEKQILAGQTLSITAIGDSVMLGATAHLQEVFPKMIIDAKVGRQIYDGAEVAKELIKENLIGETVLIGLGTNGAGSESDFDQLMAELGDRPVYLMNVHIPNKRWEGDINQLLEKIANKYKNVTLINWYEVSQGQTAWFEEDQVHPNETGLIDYTNLIAQTILAKP